MTHTPQQQQEIDYTMAWIRSFNAAHDEMEKDIPAVAVLVVSEQSERQSDSGDLEDAAP